MTNTYKHLLFFFLVLVFAPATKARHIIGGDVSYVCNGNDSYTFSMKVYRDCINDNDPANRGAPFDDPAVVTIYRKVGNTYEMFGPNVRGTQLRTNREIPPNNDPCLIIPPNVCVQEGTYQFTVDLPLHTDSYLIVYQRCCRNESITNILTPGDVGATYSIELTSLAQQVCNNSPVFNSFPPIVICANEDINYDHSANDPDGTDQLVYRFCSPIGGGGVDGGPSNPGGDQFGCTGVSPNPACPPPWDNVMFAAPAYSAGNPMGGSPQITIDNNTGLISGVPTITGQFVVGVCVEEYRNGQLLSVTRRDFQFNVASCEPTVRAEIEFDEQIGQDLYVINSCGSFDVSLGNNSFQRQFINEFYWDFDIQGNMTRFNEWEPTIAFPDTGVYVGKLVLNPGLRCGDSANVLIRVFPEAFADFEFEYDTCVAGPVDFTNLSSSDGGDIVEYLWQFGDGDTSSVIDPSHLYLTPGRKPVNLFIRDENGCPDDTTIFVDWFPAPPLIIIEPSVFDGCAPQEVFFNNLSSPIDSTYDIVWDLGDGTSSGDISPTHVYTEVGAYDVSLSITSPLGCNISDSFPSLITVRPAPIADFIFAPDQPSNFQPEVSFTDQSIDAISWDWMFGTTGSSFEQNPVYVFPDTGLQVVQLIVTHPSGCKDTIQQLIDVEPQIRYFLPNAFTPNNDDVNDGFRGGGVFEGITDFTMTIWNRWGELVFETNDPNESWNGRKNNTGQLSPMDVYVVVVTFNGPRNKFVSLKGFATLVK